MFLLSALKDSVPIAHMTMPSIASPPSPSTARRLTAQPKPERTATSCTKTPPTIVNGKSGNFSKNSEPNRPKTQRKTSRSAIPTAIETPSATAAAVTWVMACHSSIGSWSGRGRW